MFCAEFWRFTVPVQTVRAVFRSVSRTSVTGTVRLSHRDRSREQRVYAY